MMIITEIYSQSVYVMIEKQSQIIIYNYIDINVRKHHIIMRWYSR